MAYVSWCHFNSHDNWISFGAFFSFSLKSITETVWHCHENQSKDTLKFCTNCYWKCTVKTFISAHIWAMCIEKENRKSDFLSASYSFSSEIAPHKSNREDFKKRMLYRLCLPMYQLYGFEAMHMCVRSMIWNWLACICIREGFCVRHAHIKYYVASANSSASYTPVHFVLL